MASTRAMFRRAKPARPRVPFRPLPAKRIIARFQRLCYFRRTIALYAAQFEERRERDVLWSASEIFQRRLAPVGDFCEQRHEVSMSDYRRFPAGN